MRSITCRAVMRFGFASAANSTDVPINSAAVRCNIVNNDMIRIITLFVCAAVFPLVAADAPPLRLAIAGLVHGHVDGFFKAAKNRPDVEIVGIYDPDAGLHRKYAQKYGFAESVFYTDL